METLQDFTGAIAGSGTDLVSTKICLWKINIQQL